MTKSLITLGHSNNSFVIKGLKGNCLEREDLLEITDKSLFVRKKVVYLPLYN